VLENFDFASGAKNNKQYSNTMAPADPTTKKKKFVWRNSKAKALLKIDMVSGEIPLENEEMPAEEVFQRRPEYSATEWKLFPSRLRGLRKAVGFRIQEARDDAAALAHDRQLYPVSELDSRGEYKWHGSEAESYLKLDIELIVRDGLRHDPYVTPLNLWLSRLEYQIFHPDKFANHFYQAFKKVKFTNFVEKMKADKEKNLHE
jgi:hypothetical protein